MAASRETIAAIATPPGAGGIGIVRVSGSGTRALAETVLGALPSPRLARHADFRASDGNPIDQGIALFFPAPRSFTGEDVLELQGHGGPAVMDLLLRRCLELGARLARPGEFTERAFLNGKLDLAQAEAVADLIGSATERAARLAARSLRGDFSRRIDALVERLTRLRIWIEATLDFPEEELDAAEDVAMADELASILADTRAILASARQGQILREGLAVVIAGAPNAGKSSLLNALSGTDTAIVTPHPGTTRDVLRCDIQIDGLPIRILDTAGLRHTEDPVEREGVRRARAQLQEADLVLWIHDARLGPDTETRASLPPGVPVTRLRNKIDLLELASEPASPASEPPDTDDPEFSISARTGAGLELLRAHLRERAGLTASHDEGLFLARRRHLDALRAGLAHLESAVQALASRIGPELVAEDLSQAQRAFGAITGQVTSDELLGRIFSEFCIGK